MIDIGPAGEWIGSWAKMGALPHGLGTGVTVFHVQLLATVDLPREISTAGERARAARIRDPREAAFQLASHAILRALIAGALGRPTPEIELEADERGKPQLPGRPLHFNMSRSGPLVLVALSRDGEIGVDVEQVREVQDRDELARQNLTAAEYSWWRGQDAVQLDAAFLQLWAGKEACAKAAGVGLAAALQDLEVGPWPSAGLRTVRFASDGRAWTACVECLPMGQDAVGAVATIVPGAPAGSGWT